MDKNQIREVIARRAAKELKDGDVVNLGIGLPTLIPNYLPEGVTVTLQTENGAMGMGVAPAEGQEDKNLINAGGGLHNAESGRLHLRFRNIVRHHPRRSCERVGAGCFAG